MPLRSILLLVTVNFSDIFKRRLCMNDKIYLQPGRMQGWLPWRIHQTSGFSSILKFSGWLHSKCIFWHQHVTVPTLLMQFTWRVKQNLRGCLVSKPKQMKWWPGQRLLRNLTSSLVLTSYQGTRLHYMCMRMVYSYIKTCNDTMVAQFPWRTFPIDRTI